MHFLVIGHDGPTFGIADRDVDEEHQAYMDGWLPRLLARGPLLSEDGEEHRGSIHVVEADDIEAARAFATEEPYAAEGWYDEVTVTTYLPLLPGTMWDRPRPPRGTRSSFVRATWTPRRPRPQSSTTTGSSAAPSWTRRATTSASPARSTCPRPRPRRRSGDWSRTQRSAFSAGGAAGATRAEVPSNGPRLQQEAGPVRVAAQPVMRALRLVRTATFR